MAFPFVTSLTSLTLLLRLEAPTPLKHPSAPAFLLSQITAVWRKRRNFVADLQRTGVARMLIDANSRMGPNSFVVNRSKTVDTKRSHAGHFSDRDAACTETVAISSTKVRTKSRRPSPRRSYWCWRANLLPGRNYYFCYNDNIASLDSSIQISWAWRRILWKRSATFLFLSHFRSRRRRQGDAALLPLVHR